MDNKELMKKVNKAKMKLYSSPGSTFFSALLAGIRIEFSDAFPTAATDGMRMWLNPEFVEKLETNELLGLLMHELGHCYLDHVIRCKDANLNKMLYNVAGDFVINNDLDHRGYVLPGGGLIDHSYDGWSTRQVYDDLLSKGIEIQIEGDLVEGVEGEEHSDRVKHAVVKAVTQARLQGDPGSVPGTVQRAVDKLLNPVLPWNVILMDYMQKYGAGDYTWKKPKRRYWPDMYLPGQLGQQLEEISVFIDISGSIEQEDMKAFLSEIQYIMDLLKPGKLTLSAFDTSLRHTEVYQEGDSVSDFKSYGGGGTYIGPVIEYIADNTPEISIIFTDGEFGMPHMGDVITDVYWVIKGERSFKPPKGKVIQYSSEDPEA